MTTTEHHATNDSAARAVDPSAPYLLYLYVGQGEMPRIDQASVVELTPTAATADAALAAIVAAGLTAADLRTRTLFIAGPGPVDAALVVYAALCGFASRKLDVSDLREVLDARSLDATLGDIPALDDAPEHVVVGPATPLDGRSALTVHDAASIASSRKAFFQIGAATTMETLESFVAISAIRRRKNTERFPYLVLSEAFDPTVDDAASSCIDLDDVRRRAAQLRRDRRIDDRGSLVDPRELTDRQRRLVEASALPLGPVLIRLGSHEDPTTGFWRCPRPERHRNGDANPSAKIHEDGFRCFRCDLEQVDALRLTMDTKGLGPDAAADWLLTPTR